MKPAANPRRFMDGNTRRATDIHQDDKINEQALKALIRAPSR